LDYYAKYEKFPEKNSTIDMMHFLQILEQKDAVFGLLPENIVACYMAVLENMLMTMEERLRKYGPESCTHAEIIKDINRGYNRKSRIHME
jgi:hypothetical protein